MSTQEKHAASTAEVAEDASQVESADKGTVDRFSGAVVGAALITLALVGSAKAKLTSGVFF